MRKQRMIKNWLVKGGISATMILMLCGCGKQIEVTIEEPGKNASLTVDAGMTVEDILGEAQITLGKRIP